MQWNVQISNGYGLKWIVNMVAVICEGTIKKEKMFIKKVLKNSEFTSIK